MLKKPSPFEETVRALRSSTRERDIARLELDGAKDRLARVREILEDAYGSPAEMATGITRALTALTATEPAAPRVLCTFGPPAERKRHWILRFEDTDIDDMHFDDEAEAHRRFMLHSGSWTCTLFVTAEVAANSEPAARAEQEANDGR